MPDISMCVQACPRAMNCYRHPKSGTLPSEWRQAYQSYDVATCRSFVSRNNEEMLVEKAIWQFLVDINSARAVPTGRNGTWESAYNETAERLAKQLRQISEEGSDHELVVELNQVADFFQEPVEDPEMGTFDGGVRAAMRDFGVAVISVMLTRSDDARWKSLLGNFTA